MARSRGKVRRDGNEMARRGASRVADGKRSGRGALEGPTAEVNDPIRGAGSFAKAIEAVRTYQAQGMEVDFRMVLHDANAPFVGQMFELAQALHVHRLRFSSLHPVEKALRGRLSASREILDRARQQIRLLEKKYPQIRVGFNTRHTLSYTAPEWSPERCVPIIGPLNGSTLLPDGKVSFCCDVYDLDCEASEIARARKTLASASAARAARPMILMIGRFAQATSYGAPALLTRTPTVDSEQHVRFAAACERAVPHARHRLSAGGWTTQDPIWPATCPSTRMR